MNGWIDADGNPEPSTSNLAHEGQQFPLVDTNRRQGVEIRQPFDGGPAEVVRDERGTRSGGYQTYVEPEYRGSVIDTARDEGGGMIVNRRVTAKDRVILPEGYTTRVEVAANMGYLVRNPDGSFSDAQRPTEEALPGKPEGAAEGEPEGGEDEGLLKPTEEGKEALSAILAQSAPGDAILAMDEIIQLGEVTDNTVGRMASMSNMEPDQMREHINAAHQGFYDAAVARLEDAGVTNHEAFEAFVNSNPEVYKQLAEGARDLAMTNNPDKLDAVKDNFMEHADHYMREDIQEALTAAGYEYIPMPSGGLHVLIDGIPVPWQVAVRQQLITGNW